MTVSASTKWDAKLTKGQTMKDAQNRLDNGAKALWQCISTVRELATDAREAANEECRNGNHIASAELRQKAIDFDRSALDLEAQYAEWRLFSVHDDDGTEVSPLSGGK